MKDMKLPDDGFAYPGFRTPSSYVIGRTISQRKNHDFGQRELCRFGLDLYIAIYQKPITLNEEKIISSIINESISTQMEKDLSHHRVRYVNKL